MPENPTTAVQDYLKAIHRLGGDRRMVSPVEIAERLRVRAPSVTGMLKRLSESGLIEYESGKGARLSAAGLLEARRVIRRHRLVELFLHRVLGIDWSEVDAEAEALEHAISPRLEEAIARHLGEQLNEPLEDPHGHLIPDQAGRLAARDLRPVASFRPGERFVVREVQDDDPDRLKRWRQLGLTPGTHAAILSHQPHDDVFEIEVAGHTIYIGSEGLSGLNAEPIDR